MTTYKTSLTDTTPFADYHFTVSATNQMGTGAVSVQSTAAQFNFNKATGGTEATVENYNGSGEVWKTHTFTSSGTLTVEMAPQPFRVLVVGGGGGGGGSGPYYAQGSGGHSGVTSENAAMQLLSTAYSVVVGGGGSAGCNATWDAPAGGGGTSKLEEQGSAVVLSAGGGAGGKSNTAGAGAKNANVKSDISGSEQTYSGGVAGGGGDGYPGYGGGYGHCHESGQVGGSGVVIVAYRIG